MANATSRAPPPAWSEAAAPATGLLFVLAFCVLAIATEFALTRNGMRPGTLLSLLPVAAAVFTFAFAVRSVGARREGALAASIALLAMAPLVDPSGALWLLAAPMVAVVLAVGLRLEPATRIVVAIPVLAGLVALPALVAAGPVTTLGAIAAVGLYLLVLWFQLPFASGWRRVPYVATLAMALVVPVAVIVMLAMSLATDGLARPAAGTAASPGPGLGALLGAALALAAPVAVVLLGRNERARDFLIPSLALPTLERPQASSASDPSEQA